MRSGIGVRILLVCGFLLAGVTPAWAQGGADSVSNPLVLIVVFGALSLAPFVLILITSFTKIVVVLGLLKNALGTQQVPPTQVITGLAFILTFFVMAPVGQSVYEQITNLPGARDMFSQDTVKYIFRAADQGKEPVRTFLLKHTHPKDQALFVELARKMARSREDAQGITPRDFQVLVPAFVISELKEAFLIGFLLYIPFIVIDMIVSNILLAMGMFMLSPVTVSLPFKLLLFVLVDGWYLIVKGLVLSYF
jgi:type III secretion protein R